MTRIVPKTCANYGLPLQETACICPPLSVERIVREVSTRMCSCWRIGERVAVRVARIGAAIAWRYVRQPRFTTTKNLAKNTKSESLGRPDANVFTLTHRWGGRPRRMRPPPMSPVQRYDARRPPGPACLPRGLQIHSVSVVFRR
jgi:hypothetical protein